MSSPIRVRGARAVVAGVFVAVMAALFLSVPSSTAQAATPSKNTTYKDASVDSDISGSIKIKVGNNTNKIKKLTLVANCEGGSEKIVERSVSLDGDGSFDIALGPGQSIEGKFKTKHKVTGKFRTDLCGFFGGSYTAKD